MPVRSSDSQLTAMREAVAQGYAEIALMILNGSVRVYTRSPRSNVWPIKDWDRPFPEGTAGVVFLDTHDSGPPKFFVTSISEARQLVADSRSRALVPRPKNEDSRNCYITRDQVADADYQDAWDFYRPTT